jgi:hypothetical protein
MPGRADFLTSLSHKLDCSSRLPHTNPPILVRRTGEGGVGIKAQWTPADKEDDSMIWFKSCPRCATGDVLLDRDVYGSYLLCLQCGFMGDVKKPGAEALSRRLKMEPAKQPA